MRYADTPPRRRGSTLLGVVGASWLLAVAIVWVSLAPAIEGWRTFRGEVAALLRAESLLARDGREMDLSGLMERLDAPGGRERLDRVVDTVRRSKDRWVRPHDDAVESPVIRFLAYPVALRSSSRIVEAAETGAFSVFLPGILIGLALGAAGLWMRPRAASRAGGRGPRRPRHGTTAARVPPAPAPAATTPAATTPAATTPAATTPDSGAVAPPTSDAVRTTTNAPPPAA